MLRSILSVLCALIVQHVSAAPPAPVIIQTVEQSSFTETLEAIGTLNSNEAITITATVTDTVRAVHFSDGQRVEKGDVLIEMTNDEEHAQLEQARIASEEAERQYRRVKSLAKTNLATESLLDERWQAYQSAKSQLLAMQSRLNDRLIVAPFGGVLGLRNISVGSLVRPGDEITTLDDDSSMKLDMSIPAVYLNAVERGMKVIAKSSELPEDVFQGEISAVDSRIDVTTRSIQIRAQIPNQTKKLKSGMLMTVKLQRPPYAALLIPEEALVQEGFKSYVYRINSENSSNIVNKVEVETGSRTSGEILISAGLAPGDKVVTHGVMRLRPGAKVTVTAEQKKGQSIQSLIQSSKR